MPRYECEKFYGHWEGLSCVYRQCRAESHCNQLHGYALSVRLVFTAASLDARSWIMDFGSLKPVKAWLQSQFDHKLLLNFEDPEFKYLLGLHERHIADVVVWNRPTSCESFAQFIHEYVENWLKESFPTVILAAVEVAEHEGNKAIYRKE